MTEIAGVRAKTWAYLYVLNDDSEKKAKGINKSVIKRGLMFKNFKDCILNNKTILKSQQRFKSDHHNVQTEEINKIALSSNDDTRLQTFDKTTIYSHVTNAFKVCESEMIMVKITQNACLMTKSYYNHKKDLKMIVKRCIRNRSIRLR